MNFKFTAQADPALISRATELQTVGNLQDVPHLLSFLTNSDPALRAAACSAFVAIAQRTDSSAGEAGRSLKDTQQRLTDLARIDADATVRSAADAAAAAVVISTSYLPAWPMPEPSPAVLKRPHPESTTPFTTNSQSHNAPPQPAAQRTSLPPPLALTAPPSAAPASSSSTSAGAPSSEWRATKRQRVPAQTAKELKVRARDGPLYTALCELRQRLAAAESKGQHMIASNEVLAALAAARPKAYAQLLSVKGIGKHKADAYGSQFLDVIRSHPSDASLDAAAAKAEAEEEERMRAAIPTASLSPEQARATALVAEGHNVFLTGGAGTGKSYTLKVVLETLKLHHGTEHVFVTASTGIAACAIGGTTVHSWGGIGLGKDPAAELAGKILNKPVVKRCGQSPRASHAHDLAPTARMPRTLVRELFPDGVHACSRVLGRHTQPMGHVPRAGH